MSKPLDKLLELLDLEQIELDIFRGRSPDEKVQRVFGGQVAGQALVAAGRADSTGRSPRPSAWSRAGIECLAVTCLRYLCHPGRL